MNKVFIGTDIVSVPRIERLLLRYQSRFRRHVFSAWEVKYCENKPHPALHYAGRFAAKEAVKKALLSSGLISVIPLSAIEISATRQGAPLVNLTDTYLSSGNCQVSISHTDEYAVAQAVLIL